MIIVMGLPGAGKTTVLQHLNASSLGYKVINYGDMMLEIAKERYGVENRDEIRKLDIHKQSEIQELVGKKLAGERGKVLLDTHCTIKTQSGFLPGLPFGLLKNLKVDALVLITAPIEEIIERRRKDKNRPMRDKEEREELEMHDMFNREFLATYSALTAAPAVVITNANGKLEEAVARLRKLLS